MAYGLLVEHFHMIQSQRLVRFVVRLVLIALVRIVFIVQLESSQRTVIGRSLEVRTVRSHLVFVELFSPIRIHQQFVGFVYFKKFGLCLWITVWVPINWMIKNS